MVRDSEPVVDAAGHTQRRGFELYGSNLVVRTNILIHDLHEEIVSNVMNVEIADEIPLGQFTRAILGRRPELILPQLNHTVRIHLSKSLSIPSQLRLNNCQLQLS